MESFLLIVEFSTINFLNIFFKKMFISMHLPASIMFFLLYIIPFSILFLFIFYQSRKKNLKIDLPIKRSHWSIYIIILFMMFGMVILNDFFSSFIPRKGPILGNLYKEIELFLHKEMKHPIAFFSTTILVAPFCEEILFRGVILNGMLKNKIHPIKAVLFSSFLFGMAHMNPWQFVGGMFIGSFIGFIFYTTSSIVNCILLHMINNMVAVFTMFFLSKYHYNKIYSFSERNNIYYWSFLILGINILLLGSLLMLKKKKDLEIQTEI